MSTLNYKWQNVTCLSCKLCSFLSGRILGNSLFCAVYIFAYFDCSSRALGQAFSSMSSSFVSVSVGGMQCRALSRCPCLMQVAMNRRVGRGRSECYKLRCSDLPRAILWEACFVSFIQPHKNWHLQHWLTLAGLIHSSAALSWSAGKSLKYSERRPWSTLKTRNDELWF